MILYTIQNTEIMFLSVDSRDFLCLWTQSRFMSIDFNEHFHKPSCSVFIRCLFVWLDGPFFSGFIFTVLLVTLLYVYSCYCTVSFIHSLVKILLNQLRICTFSFFIKVLLYLLYWKSEWLLISSSGNFGYELIDLDAGSRYWPDTALVLSLILLWTLSIKPTI